MRQHPEPWKPHAVGPFNAEWAQWQVRDAANNVVVELRPTGGFEHNSLEWLARLIAESPSLLHECDTALGVCMAAEQRIERMQEMLKRAKVQP